MREIKFRVWDKNKEVMVIEPGFIQFSGEPKRELAVYHEDIREWEEEGLALMQFTGLHDKNSKEIYEGDIVSVCTWIDWKTNKSRRWKRGREVVWFKDECRFSLKNEDGETDIWNLFGTQGYEVIGNIYENPELLKEQS